MKPDDYYNKFYSKSYNSVKGTNLRALVPLTLGFLESNNYKTEGLSPLAMPPNNALFGIKANKGYKGKSKIFTTIDADANGNRYTNQAAFRIYDNYQQSFDDFIRFLKVNSNYEKAGLWKAQTAAEQFQALERAGYAATGYANVLIPVYNNFVQIQKKLGTTKPTDDGNGSWKWYLLGATIVIISK